MAFFPSYPILFIRPLAQLLRPCLVESTAYLFSAVLINFLLGLVNTFLIFQLGLKYRLKQAHAYWAAIVYAINPASVFFLAPYSESLFLFSQLLAHVYLQSDRLFAATLCFAFGSTIRSNGLVSFGFILYYCLQRTYQTRRLVFPVHCVLICLIPFILTQYYQYRAFCFERPIPSALINYGEEYQLKMPLTNFSSPWCEKQIPFSYQYVQKTYWNVGFLNYWRWKQLPNFLLALPVFLLVCSAVRQWYRLARKDLWQERFSYLFLDTNRDKAPHWLTWKVFLPHLVYTLFLSLFAFFFMHIQVTTRFLFSSGPFLYFICADRIKQYDISTGSLRKIFSLLRNETYFFFYCVTYTVVGICLFSNFLPWT